MMDYITGQCYDCILWDGHCSVGQEAIDLPDDGSCWDYSPRSIYESDDERKERIRKEKVEKEAERKVTEDMINDLIVYPVYNSFKKVPGKRFKAVNVYLIPTDGGLRRVLDNAIYSREQLWGMLSGYYLEKEWYELQFQMVEIKQNNPDNLPGVVVMLTDEACGSFYAMNFLIME